MLLIVRSWTSGICWAERTAAQVRAGNLSEKITPHDTYLSGQQSQRAMSRISF